MRRKLTAVVAADMVSYSRLMNEDETAVLRALETLRTRFLEPLAAKHGGRLFRLIGDGMMLEFESAAGAVDFAAELQRSLAQYNAENPWLMPVVLRIGVNLGDAVVENGDLHGEGVTIAARIESLSEPGGICVTDAVHAQIRHRLGADFVSIGPRSLKNIPHPVHLWRWRPVMDRDRHNQTQPQSRLTAMRGQYLIESGLLALVLNVHARSMLLAISDALDATARKNGGETPFEAFFVEVSAELTKARQLLSLIKVERLAEAGAPEAGGLQQSLTDFVRSTFHDPGIGYAAKVIPEVQAILAGPEPYLVKRTRLLDLIRRHHDDAFIQQSLKLIDYAYIE